MKLKNLLKLKKYKGPAPYKAKGFRSGFALLFAVTIASLLLSIALGVANVALREVRFSTNGRDTNDAFFAADTGIEFAIYTDETSPFDSPDPLTGATEEVTPFPIAGLGASGQGCVLVTVTKTLPPVITTIVAKGYNAGSSGGDCIPPANSVEREIDVKY